MKIRIGEYNMQGEYCHLGGNISRDGRSQSNIGNKRKKSVCAGQWFFSLYHKFRNHKEFFENIFTEYEPLPKWNKDLGRIKAFEMLCYMRIMKVRWVIETFSRSLRLVWRRTSLLDIQINISVWRISVWWAGKRERIVNVGRG